MLMESIGNWKMKTLDSSYYLDEMQINYMSVGKKGISFTVDVNEDDITATDSDDGSGLDNTNATRLNVKALNEKGSSISEGLLTYKKCRNNSQGRGMRFRAKL